MSDLPVPRSRPAAVPSSEQGTPVSSDVDNSPNNRIAQQAADPDDDDDDDEDLDEDGEGDDDDEEDAEGDDDEEEEEEEAQDEEMEYVSPTEDEDNEDDDDDDDEDDADFDPTAEVDPRTSTAQPAAVDADVELDLLGTLEGPSNAGGLPAKARSRGPIKIKVKLDKKAVLAVTPSGTGAGAVKAVGSRAKGKAPAKGKAAAGGRGRTKARATGTSSSSRKSSKRKLSEAGESGDELDDEGEEDLDGAGDEDGEGEEEEGSDSSEDFSNLDPELSYSRTTMRQLAKEDQRLAGDLIALPLKDESRKKQLSEAEQALRKSEMARRRRNQTEKKLEDDKTETINRLLKKQVSRSRSKLGAEGADGGEAGTPTTTDLTSQTSAGRRVGGVTKEMQAENKKFARPLFRYISNAGGATVSVPMHKERGVVDGKARNEYERRWSEVFVGSGVKRAKIEVVGGEGGGEGGGG